MTRLHDTTTDAAHALHDSKEAFRLLVVSMKDCAVFLLDADGCIVSWNDGAKRISGYTEQDVLGQHIALFYVPEDRIHNAPAHELKQAREGPLEQEGWRIRKDGTRFPAHISLSPRRDTHNTLSGYVSVTRDLSRRYKMEERFRRIIDAAPNAMIMINAAGLIEMVNTQAERLFGYAREELLGHTIEMLVPGQFREHHPDMRSAFFYNPHSRPMGKGRDLRALRKDGSEFPVEIGLNPIETDEGTKVLSAIVDISERKRMEERLRQIVESAPNAIVMINKQGIIEMVNAQTERVFGYPREELLGQTIEMLVPERFQGHHPNMRTVFFSDPQSRPIGKGRDLYARRKDGSEFPVEIGLNPIETDEGTKVLSAIVDISDRKQKELKIEAALKEKDIMLGEIHHRVKNNLQVVHSLLDLQSSQIKDPAVQEMLRDSQNRIRSMALIHQSLYQSKDFARVNFNTVLETLVPILLQSYRAGDQSVEFALQTEEVHISLNLAIPCGLIINELITNAIKHAFPDKRQGLISVRLFQENQQITLSVSDNGKGIPPDLDLQQCGTLGLQLVYLLTEQLNAELSIQRANPTCFSFRFAMETTEADLKWQQK
jgi:PAS domain S-box-containing protein